MPPSRRRSKAASAAVDPLAEYRRALGNLNSAERTVHARIERTVKKHEDDSVFLAFEDNRVLKLYSCGLRCRHCAICKCGVAVWREPTNDTTIRFLTPFNWCADAPEDFLLSTLVDVLRRMDSVPSIVILSVPRSAVERLRLLILGLAFVMDHSRIREMHVFLAAGGDVGYHYQRLSAAMDAQSCRTVQEVATLALPDETVRTTTVRAPLFKMVDIVATLETEQLDEPTAAFVLARNGEGEVTYRTSGFMPEAMWAARGGKGGQWGKRLEAMLEEYEARRDERTGDAPPQPQPQQKQAEEEAAPLVPLFAPLAPPSSPLSTALEIGEDEPDCVVKEEVMEWYEEERRKEEEGGGGEAAGEAEGAVADSLQKPGDNEEAAAAAGGGGAETVEKASGSATVATADVAAAGAGAVEQKADDAKASSSSAAAVKQEPGFVQFDFGPGREQIMKAATKPVATTPPPSGGVPVDELLQPPAKKQRKQASSSKLEVALEAAMQQQAASASGSDIAAAGAAGAAAAVAAISPEQREALVVATTAAEAEQKKRSLRPRKETPRAVSVPAHRYRWGAQAAAKATEKKESSVVSSSTATRVKEEKKEAMEVKKERKKSAAGRPRKEGKGEKQKEESGDEEEEEQEEEEEESDSYGAVVVFKKARFSTEGRRAMAAKLAPADVDVADRIGRLCATLEENGDATEALLEQWQRIGKAMQPKRKADTLLAALQEISATMPPVGLAHPVVDFDCYLHD